MNYESMNLGLYISGLIVGLVLGFNIFYRPDRSRQVQEAKEWYRKANKEFDRANEWYAKAQEAYKEAGKFFHASRTAERIIDNEHKKITPS